MTRNTISTKEDVRDIYLLGFSIQHFALLTALSFTLEKLFVTLLPFIIFLGV